MTLPESILLGLVQGLTEFLPVSSSGHLVLAETLLGVKKSGISFEVSVHLATAVAVAVYYRARLWGMLTALPLVFSPGSLRNISPDNETAAGKKENLRLVWLVFLGTLPAAAAGLFFRDFFEGLFQSPHLVCVMLLVTGALLMATRLLRPDKERTVLWHTALVIGLAQACAIMPGISRSGATIAVALILGIGATRAAEFSFLLALPAICGAGFLELREFLVSGSPAGLDMTVLLTGSVTALASGYLAIVLLIRILLRGRFDRFAWYCWTVGLAGLVLF